MTMLLYPLASQIRVSALTVTIGKNTAQVPIVSLEGPQSVGKVLVADPATIPCNLSKLIPARWGNAKPKEWLDFVWLAIAMGKL